MHLPFTFATGEAMLYQTGYPLHGFPDSFQGKAKGSKSKKSKQDKNSSEDLDPKGLLGALMSQDESVYVCQPDPEPKMSYHSSLFSEQPGDSSYGGSKTSFDPLLATLDSLSLDGEETCSNSELFNALENLGLNAEDLELLLLDERMMQVELDPNHIPTLSDLLTNNEILSYIHDALENGTEGEDDAGATQQPPAAPPAPPIIQLSQQMQQHASAGVSQHAPVDTKVLPGIPNGHWVVTTENHHNHQHAHSVVKASPLNGKHLSQQWQLQQEQHSLHLQTHHQPPGFQATNGSYIPNGHSAFPPNMEVSHAGYSTPHPAGSALNGATPDVCHYQSLVSTTRPCQLQTQVPPSCFPAQSSTLELEQLLGLSPPQHSLPALEAYSMFNTATPDSAHSKVTRSGSNSVVFSAARSDSLSPRLTLLLFLPFHHHYSLTAASNSLKLNFLYILRCYKLYPAVKMSPVRAEVQISSL